MGKTKAAHAELTDEQRAQIEYDEAVAAAALRGAKAPGEATVHYVLYEDGSAGRITTSGLGLGELAKPGREVTQAEYETAVAELHAVRGEHLDELQAADEARLRRHYEALIGVGVAADVAGEMSGYTPAGV
ncbi:hypothetical protein AB0F17_28835 [Nonomuraea sp. NPDC026600]|uniref:hypothetical protein n=1 Tax=Nonomuraea sp. NPDC026600 TaxID=3155363 RepID=UPI0033E88C98